MPEDAPFTPAYPLTVVREGSTDLQVPQSTHVRGPKKKEGVPFYNPTMRTARDISVLALAEASARAQRPLHVCDAMASLGARGLRMAHEVPGTTVLVNDANPDSVALARRNAERLLLTQVTFRTGRLEPLLTSETFDWVDIDPFGTAAGFLDPAVLGVKDEGILAVTATDKASLSGVYPAACLRRYNARPRRGPCMPELAVRILLGAIVRAAGRHDRAASPLLSYSTEHYVRTYVRIHGGPTQADADAGQLGFAVFHPDGRREIVPEAPSHRDWAGPLWGGPLVEPAFVASLAERAAEAPGLAASVPRLLGKIVGEAALPALYYTIDEFTRGRPVEAPRLEVWLERIRATGHRAARTHFDPYGIKTTATPTEIQDCLSGPRTATA